MEFLRSTADFPEVVAGRYVIEGFVGAGGMGAVYRARDRELDELVALKVLRHELCCEPQAIARFRREVKLARRVTHRNVARTFDIGAHAGLTFLTMELVQGESLAQRLARKKRLPLERAVEIALEIARGLAAAHEAGVVHRDLKPDNVLLSREGRVVVTDFGVAFAQEGLGGGAGRRLIGTPAYMAPEQLEAPEAIDARVDVFALGLVLYEMLTGELPWTGATDLALATARLVRPPRDPRELVPDLPDAVALVLAAALARDVTERIPSAEAMIAELSAVALPTSPTLLDDLASSRSLLPGPPPTPIHKLAVLKLEHLGSEDDAYVTTGVGEALIDALASAWIRVRACPADMQSRDAPEVGRDLGVDAVVAGSVEIGPADVRLALRLVGSNDGFVLWAGRFGGARGEVLSIAQGAAQGLAEAMSGARPPTPLAIVASPEAVDLYLRGRSVYHRFWRTHESVALLEQAHAKAPGDARILAALALALSRETGAETDTAAARESAKARAELAATRAPSLPDAQVALGVARLHEGDSAAAASLVRRALDLAPGHVDALEHAAHLLLETRAIEEGIAHAELAMRVEPALGLVMPYQIIRARALLREWDAVDAAFRARPSQDAARVTYWLTRVRLAIWRGDDAERARVSSELAADTLPNKGFVVAFARCLESGPLGGVERQLLVDRAQSPKSSPRHRAFFAQVGAEILARKGEREEALTWLEAAVGDGLFDEAWLERCPAIDTLRDDERFERAREQVRARGAAVAAALLRGVPTITAR